MLGTSHVKISECLRVLLRRTSDQRIELPDVNVLRFQLEFLQCDHVNANVESSQQRVRERHSHWKKLLCRPSINPLFSSYPVMFAPSMGFNGLDVMGLIHRVTIT